MVLEGGRHRHGLRGHPIVAPAVARMVFPVPTPSQDHLQAHRLPPVPVEEEEEAAVSVAVATDSTQFSGLPAVPAITTAQ
jgi:hypothetical protein